MIIIKGTKVGTTDITSTYVDGGSSSDTQEFEVTAVSLSSISKPENNTYNGTYWEPVPTVTAIVDGVSTVLVKDEDFTLSYSNNRDVGTATVTATGINNFTGTVSNTWTIVGADMTVTANDQSYDYDGQFHGYPITVSTVNNQTATIRYRTTSSGEYNLTSEPQFKDVVNSGYEGTVYFKVTAPNHKDYTGTYHLEIYPLEAVLSWGTLEWTYDGNAHGTTCTVTNLISGDTCMVILSGNSITNIGQTTVTATGLSNSNYSLPSDVTRTLIIAAGLFVKLSGIWTPVKKVYKRVSGSWVEQEITTAFSASEAYIKKN